MQLLLPFFVLWFHLTCDLHALPATYHAPDVEDTEDEAYRPQSTTGTGTSTNPFDLDGDDGPTPSPSARPSTPPWTREGGNRSANPPSSHRRRQAS